MAFSRQTYPSPYSPSRPSNRRGLFLGLLIILVAQYASHPALLYAKEDFPCLGSIIWPDAIVVANPSGQVIYKKNETRRCVPASTLKILTALNAIHCLGGSYRFPTEFYLDQERNLTVKGYGDPLLVSEVWQDMSEALADRVQNLKDLILDGTYFSRDISIPGQRRSTNPYDAPVGALCANFNTIFFDRGPQGKIVSAEPQTPLIPFAREKIRSLGLKRGRYTFTHNQGNAALYAGKLLGHFLEKRGVEIQGKIRPGIVRPKDRLIYTYRSEFTLEQALKKMLEFSNNFMANQILIALGAHKYGPPGTLGKGVRVITDFAKEELGIEDITIVEGSGISRENRLSALDMLAVLKRFRSYRHLLRREGRLIFKTGSLKGIRTRAGYIEGGAEGLYPFVIFLNRPGADINPLVECIKGSLT